MPRVSIIIPCFNESRSIRALVERVLALPLEMEVLIVDDGSTDGSAAIIRHDLVPRGARALTHSRNQGKGAAVRTALAQATGEIVIIQDADGEYAPEEYDRLLEPILAGRADVVYGSRFLDGAERRQQYFLAVVGNRVITTLSNIVTSLTLSDVECGFKVFRRSYLKNIVLEENGFGVEVELTIKLARQGAVFAEVPVSYQGRSYADGKKITWRDGFSALRCIAKYSRV